jgi:ABC-type sugar transport system ATPase subunit
MTIKLENISFGYTSETILENVNLSFCDKSVTAILGPSGCGKTSLLRCIAGLEKVNQGKFFIDDKLVINKIPNEITTSMVFQDLALYQTLSVKENIQLALKSRKAERNLIEKKTQDITNIFEINHLISKKVSNLSGGERQRVAIARSLILEPNLLLLDEPFSNIDTNIKLRIRQTLKKFFEKSSSTVIIVTHDQDDAFALADNIVIMKDGNVKQQGNPIDLYYNPKSRFVAEFIGNPQINIFEVDKNLLFLEKFKSQKIIGIRPEHIAFSSNNGDNEICLNGVLVSKKPQFPMFSYEFDTDLGVIMSLSKDYSLEIGDKTKIFMPLNLFLTFES